MPNRRRWMVRLMHASAVMLGISACARLVAEYAARSWRRLREKRHFSVDVIAPNYGPAMVVSTDDFMDEPDPIGKILEDSFHTRVFRRVAWLETVRRICAAISICVMGAAFILWLSDRSGDR